MILRASVVALLCALAACGGADSPTRPGPPSPGLPTISSVDPLTPGQSGLLRGTNLRAVTGLAVDGKAAGIEQATDTELRFSVPALRACETDGRRVDVVVNGAIRTQASVAAPGVVSLQPGESRVMSAAELGCVRFGAGTAAYVLSAHNFSRERVSERFFRLRTYTVAQDTMASAFPAFQAGPAPAAFARERSMRSTGNAQSTSLRTSAAAAPFDPGYATAAVGDTLVFVDWARIESVTATTRDQVPVYRAVIVALAGQQVVALDLRTPDAPALLASEAVRERFRRAAQIADRFALPAVRAVIDPQAAYPAGAGGRLFTIVRELPAGVAGGITTADLSGTGYSRWVSDIGVVDLSAAAFARQTVRPEGIAATMIHETAHLADVLAARKRGLAGAAGWVSEAFAVAVEERAARMAVGQEHQVTLNQVQADGVPAAAMRMPDITSQLYSPWGPFGSGVSASSTGAYVRGTRMLLYAMEHLGETGFSPTSTSLYQRLLARSAAPGTLSPEQLNQIWGIDAIANETGLSAEALMEQASLAELSDDLVDLQAAAARGLPQFKTWSNALAAPTELQQRIAPTHWLPSDAARTSEVSVPAGAHHYWYVVTEPGRGLSVAATNITLQAHHRVRITRLW